MKRLLIIVCFVVVTALVALLLLRQKEASAAAVARLLPADTAVFIHIPDLEQSREAWQHTDLFQLYHEPAVQVFLHSTKAKLPAGGASALHDAAALRIQDAFLATNTVDSLRLVGGFEFRCGEPEARRIISDWQARALPWGSRSSTTTYQKYSINVISCPRFTLAEVFAAHRFFAATNVEDLKALLDRLDGRGKDTRLDSDANFRVAMKQMPADYAALLYLQPKAFAQKLAALRAQSGRASAPGGQTLLARMQSFSHALVFEGPKLREVDFTAMPRRSDAKLTRQTLASAPADTLLYLAMILDWRRALATPNAQPAVLANAGISSADLAAAFGDEVSLIGDWTAGARLPGTTATLDVRDGARARKIADGLAAYAGWESSSRGNLRFFTAPASGLALMRLVAGVSDKQLAIGFDASKVERALSPAALANPLSSTADFREASRLVPEPETMFAWLDLGALYSRLDATLRPLLQIGAAFMPESSSRLDVSKLPPAESVAKHLGSTVSSQQYLNGGYRLESVGTITLDQAIVLGGAGYARWFIGKDSATRPGAVFAAPSPAP